MDRIHYRAETGHTAIIVNWMSQVNDLKPIDPFSDQRCHNEILITSERDEIDLDSIEDIAEVTAHGARCQISEGWCCRKIYDCCSHQFLPATLNQAIASCIQTPGKCSSLSTGKGMLSALSILNRIYNEELTSKDEKTIFPKVERFSE